MADAMRAVSVLLVLLGAGCGDDQDPEGAADLWERLQTADYRNNFTPAPGHDQRIASRAAHGDGVQIFVNDIVADSLAGPSLDQWPIGSLIVKDGYSGSDVCLVAAMEKTGDDEWFWAEWNADGDTLFSGAPTLCTGCHRIGEDWVRGIFLP